MKKRVLAALAVGLAAFCCGGCVQMHVTTEINDDGSGTADLKMSLSAVVLEAMTEMKALGMDENQDMEMPDFDKINRADIEKKAKGHGVKVLAFDKSDVEGRPTLVMKLAFEDLEGLTYVMGSVMGENPEEGMGIFAAEGGNFVLKTATYDFPDEPAEEAEIEIEEEAVAMDPADPELMQKQMAIMGKMMGAMAELDVSMKITVPGDIIESNAPTVEGKTSIWTINSSNMMTAGQDMEPHIVFSGKGLKIRALEE